MLSSSDNPRKTRMLPDTGNARSGVTLQAPDLPSAKRSEPLPSLQTSARLPIVIPGEKKRQITQPLAQPTPRRPHKRIAWYAVLLVGSLSVILAFSFAVPLSTGQQKPITLAQGISNLFTTGQFGDVNTAQHSNQPTISTNCGGIDIWGTCAKALLDNGTVGSGQMQSPIKGAQITQLFANPEYQVWCGCVKPHSGIDLATTYGTPITAADSGEVIWVGWDWSGLGWAVKVSHGNFLATIYGHMARYVVKVGQYVTKGQTVGYEGSTGASTGPHVHFMVLVYNQWVNPQDYMQLP
ncbi:MAG TPA: M23 family metallopeptidase [Ktedonobacteraceae bacterium]|nr:M23 family metallopeptidase [Ktedonobacteraceae bacterium]